MYQCKGANFRNQKFMQYNSVHMSVTFQTYTSLIIFIPTLVIVPARSIAAYPWLSMPGTSSATAAATTTHRSLKLNMVSFLGEDDYRHVLANCIDRYKDKLRSWLKAD